MAIEFIDGNEAVARGAIAAGCDFFAGYPITPASSILQFMLDWLPSHDGVAVQAEDEIASIGFCLGAAMAGRKAMTATSGPGISLYSENIGLAIIGETPLVIVDVQRQGPATGSATKGADSDVQFVRWGTSGGLPIIALAPATVEEAYELTYVAFNLAEQYRVPVFLMSQKEIGLTRERVDLDAIELPPRIDRKRPDADAPYEPHGFDSPEQVGPLADFGGPSVVRYTTSTHDHAAFLTADPGTIGKMIEHYRAKIDAAADAIARVTLDLQDGADTLVISYGVTARSAAVAVANARARGQRVSQARVATLWPLPEAELEQAMAGVSRVIVPEMNLGQYRQEIERLAPPGVEVIGVNRMDTTLIPPEAITTAGGLSS